MLLLLRRCCWHGPLVLAVSLTCQLALAAAPVVKVWGAPLAAVQALRSAQPGIVWLAEGSETGVSQPQLQVAWQQDAYQRALATSNRSPILLLSQQLVPAVRLRNQDSALIWGPPLALQVQLTRRLMPLAKRVGVLFREHGPAQAELSSLQNASVANELKLLPLPVDAPLTARALAEAADQVDVFIATNDDTLFNRDSAKLILLTAYQHQRAVIGPTPAFVSAGAMATEAVPKAALIAAIVARVGRWQDSGSLGESQAVTRFAPVFNAQVARSLSVPISPDLWREVQP